MSFWIDTHCHLDAPEFAADIAAVRAQAAIKNVAHCVLPAVEVSNFDAVRTLAHAQADSYALGIHPLYVKRAQDGDLLKLDAALSEQRDDPRLLAVGEIGLDYFVPELTESPLRERQEFFYLKQLRLARKHGLPLILHVRRSADKLLQGLRQVAQESPASAGEPAWRGIAHAFNGSEQQAAEFIKLGLKLGFGGAMTFERAQQLRRLAIRLPLEAIVLETDSPDMPPHWLNKTSEQRAAGEPQGRNEPGELPHIAQELAQLRGIDLVSLALSTRENACQALPKMRALLA
jgi:TatD DNase family protein